MSMRLLVDSGSSWEHHDFLSDLLLHVSFVQEAQDAVIDPLQVFLDDFKLAVLDQSYVGDRLSFP